MIIETLKHRYKKIHTAFQSRYWPSTVHYLESKSPARLFIKALMIGLILSVPWQCSRIILNNYISETPEKTNENNSTLSLPDFSDGSVTNMPNPKARRPIPVPIEIAPQALEEQSQFGDISSSNSITQSDQDAKVLIQTAPEYPASSLRKRESGIVLLKVTIDANGTVIDADIEKSSNYRTLDRAARKSVAKWKFSPKIENGVAVPSQLLIPIEYKSE
jgi:TonB family protein